MTITLVAASHGTSVPAAQLAITALVDAVRDALPRIDVREACVDVQQPRLDDVADSLDGPSVVVPLLLTSGFHLHVDIARSVDRPNVVAARALGPDPLLTALLLRRLGQCGATPDDVIVLAAAGSTDPRAMRDVDAAARLLGSAWGAPVPVGYVSGAGLPIAEIVRNVARSGRRVVLASYVMAPGFFYEQLRSSGAGMVARPLLDGTDVESEMIALVIDRFAEAAEMRGWSCEGIPGLSVRPRQVQGCRA